MAPLVLDGLGFIGRRSQGILDCPAVLEDAVLDYLAGKSRLARPFCTGEAASLILDEYVLAEVVALLALRGPAAVGMVAGGDAADEQYFLVTLSAADRERIAYQAASVARRVVARYGTPPGVELEDVEAEARLGALLALRGWDEARGASPMTLACDWAKGYARHYARDWNPAWRIATSTRGGSDLEDGRIHLCREISTPLSLDEPIDWSGRGHEGFRIRRGETIPAPAGPDDLWLRLLLARLTQRERTFLRLYYWEGLSQIEIGELCGMSQMSVSRAMREALGRLRAWVESG